MNWLQFEDRAKKGVQARYKRLLQMKTPDEVGEPPERQKKHPADGDLEVSGGKTREGGEDEGREGRTRERQTPRTSG
jgi:hypothetical protein